MIAPPFALSDAPEDLRVVRQEKHVAKRYRFTKNGTLARAGPFVLTICRQQRRAFSGWEKPACSH